MSRFQTTASVCKIDEKLGLVFGYAIVCKIGDEPYFDSQGDHITEDAMLRAAADFMENARVAKEMHKGEAQGSIVFAFPLTTDICSSLGLSVEKTGLVIAMKPSDEMLAKFKSGQYTGFSIGGLRGIDEEVEETNS